MFWPSQDVPEGLETGWSLTRSASSLHEPPRTPPWCLLLGILGSCGGHYLPMGPLNFPSGWMETSPWRETPARAKNRAWEFTPGQAMFQPWEEKTALCPCFTIDLLRWRECTLKLLNWVFLPLLLGLGMVVTTGGMLPRLLSTSAHAVHLEQ
jgi:hypothetical protein